MGDIQCSLNSEQIATTLYDELMKTLIKSVDNGLLWIFAPAQFEASIRSCIQVAIGHNLGETESTLQENVPNFMTVISGMHHQDQGAVSGNITQLGSSAYGLAQHL